MSDPVSEGVDLNELEAAEKLADWLHRAGWNESAATVDAVVARLRQAEAATVRCCRGCPDCQGIGIRSQLEAVTAEVVSLREALAAEKCENFRMTLLYETVPPEQDALAVIEALREALATAETLCKAAVAIIDGTTYTDDVSDQYDEALAAWRSSRPVGPPTHPKPEDK